MLSFSLKSGENITGKVLIELARARGCTIEEVKHANERAELTFKEIDIAMERAIAIDHAREAVAYGKIKEEAAEEQANIDALKKSLSIDDMDEIADDEDEGSWNIKHIGEYIGAIGEVLYQSSKAEVPYLDADLDSVAVYRGGSSRWELIGRGSVNDQDLADLLLTQTLIDLAVDEAKRNSSWRF